MIGVENILPGVSQILQRHLFVESGEGNIDFLEYQNQLIGVINILRYCKKYLFGTGYVKIPSKCM